MPESARPPQKYRSKPLTIDGIRFASQAEANRWCELKVLKRDGFIRDLIRQPRFPLVVLDTAVGQYVGDFEYYIRDKTGLWVRVVEDVKGHPTPLYKLKKKLMKAIFGIDIAEIKK